MLIDDENTILTLKVNLRSETKTEFANWQALLNAKLTAFPGFVSLEFISPTGSSQQWLIVQRFENADKLTTWLEGSDYKNLRISLQKLIQGEVQEELSSMSSTLCGVTEVFVTQISPAKEMEYRKWTAKMHQYEAKFPGFKGVFVQAPAKGLGKHWITLLQFDTQENLDRWLASEERRKILEESKSLISTLESHRIYSPFAGWFKSIQEISGEVPPVWKQTLIVLLVLFPIVMLEMRFLNPWTAGLNPSLAMFIGNAISVTLISWPMMPLAIFVLGWWLTPQAGYRLRNTLFGALLVLILYLIEILLFWKT